MAWQTYYHILFYGGALNVVVVAVFTKKVCLWLNCASCA
jgi:hypothetical protein